MTEYGKWRSLIDGAGVIPDSVIDHFEPSLYDDQGKTLSDYYTGDISQFARQQTTLQEGSYALEAGGSGAIIGSRKDIQQGDTVRWDIRVGDSQGNPALLFGGDSDRSNSFEAIPVNLQRDSVGIQVFENGSFVTRYESSLTASADTWYVGELVWNTDDSITLRALDTNGSELASVTVTDSTFTTGTGYGIFSDPDTPNYYDNIRFV